MLFIVLVQLCSSKIVYVVDIGYKESTPLSHKIAVLACQGLINRGDTEHVFTLKEGWDEKWLSTAEEYDPDLEPMEVPSYEFINDICGSRNFSKMHYNSQDHHVMIPQLITLAGVLDAVPLATNDEMDKYPGWQEQQLVFDASFVFPDLDELTEALATQFVYVTYGHLTTGVSMMNPGWKQRDDLHPFEIELANEPDVGKIMKHEMVSKLS